MRAQQIGKTGGIAGPTGASMFGQSGLSGLEFGAVKPATPSTGSKKFLPARPSLQDVLAVAPQWRNAFEKINKEIVERDEHLAQLKSLLKELKLKNEAQKAALTGNLEVVKAHQTEQQAIESEIELFLPVISNLQRQSTSLFESCERTVSHSETRGASSYQPLSVPQPENLRFVSDLGDRVHLLQERADALSRSISFLSDALKTGASLPTFTAEIKTALNLLMAQYRQIKLRQLGLHEELQASIDRYKQAHQLGPNFDRYLEDQASSQTLGLETL